MDGGGSIEGSGSGVSVGSGSTGVAVDEVLGDCSVGSDEVDGAADVGDGLCVGDGVAVAVGSGVGVAEADGEGDGSALSEGSGLSDGGGLGDADADGVGSGASLDGGAGSEGSAVGAIHEDAERAGLRPRIRHLANSAATLTNPSARFDMVRPGVSIYGLSPVPDIGGPTHFGLREAMRVVARLINVKDCPPGQGISYGHQYTTKGDTRLGLVPLGYADGIPRHASGVGPMRVHGRRYTVAGRVCMDQMVLDLGADSPAVAGDEVVLIGREADGEPTAQDWAAAIDTINYEIVTRLGPRVPRRYLGGL